MARRFGVGRITREMCIYKGRRILYWKMSVSGSLCDRLMYLVVDGTILVASMDVRVSALE